MDPSPQNDNVSVSIPIPCFELDSNIVNRDALIAEQGKDVLLGPLFQQCVSDEEAKILPKCYLLVNDVLVRKWRPPEVPANDEWKVLYQIVVPRPYQENLLSLAHDIPMAGHLGVSKTYHRLLNHFFWPGIKTSVINYVKSCHECQMKGKPNQVIPKAPLVPIPAFDEPFSKIIVDVVGPLPKTKAGNQFLLTIMCSSTRFPEAIPLRNISAPVVVKHLIKFFSLVGLPREVQSDRGSNFMSNIFQQVLFELQISQVASSPYHPESQGALERFHGTLKSMIRAYCLQHDKDWDEGVHLLLFAVRESVQESTGFSPFELVFGHSVRGPLKMLHERWLVVDSSVNLLNYVSEFRNRLHNACNFAKENLKNAQRDMKIRYDKKAKVRKFEPGDKVLVFLPVPGQALQAKFFGPYTIDRKVSEVDYLVNTPFKRRAKRLCHVNMLKEYIDRDGVDIAVKPVCVGFTKSPELESVIELPNLKLNNHKALANLPSELVIWEMVSNHRFSTLWRSTVICLVTRSNAQMLLFMTLNVLILPL